MRKMDCYDCLCHFDLQFVDSTLPLRGGAGRLHLIECSSGHEFEQLSDYRSQIERFDITHAIPDISAVEESCSAHV